MIVHAAAPCPVEVKQRFLDWLGPIVHEFYSGSEGAGFCDIGPEEWLAHPGSVGRSMTGAIHILDDDGRSSPWARRARCGSRPTAPSSTTATRPRRPRPGTDRGWSTMGDVGRVDDDGYLYLTDRVART